MIHLLLATSLVLAPQEPFPDLPDPQGIVRDEQGNALAGAELGLEPTDKAPHRWRSAILHVLQTQPVPPMTSGRDGTFVLPLTRDQRRLGAHLGGALAFTVRLPGYQDWIEALPLGVYGWLGSQVTLHRPVASEWCEVRMADAVPGMVARVDSPYLPAAVVPLDDEGRARVPVYSLPSPPALEGGQGGLGWGATVRVLYPGRSSAAVPVEVGNGVLELTSQPTELARTVAVRAPDGREMSGLRGLYRVGIECLWFPLHDAEAPSDATCELVAVCADGYLFADAMTEDELELRPLPDSQELRVLDPAGRPLARAAVYYHPLAHWYQASDLSHQSPSHRGRTDRNGTFALLDRLRDQPGCIEIAAPGFQLLRFPDPRPGGEFRLQPMGCGGLRLRLRSALGNALAGATVFLSDSAYSAGLVAERVPVTDRDGVLALEHLPVGQHSLVPVIEGHAISEEKFAVVAGETTDLELELMPAAEIRVVAVDDDDRPVPFLPLSRDWQNDVGPRREYATDSGGRLWIRDIPADKTLVLRQSSHGAGRGLRLHAEEVQRITVDRGRLVNVLMPPGSRVFRTIWHQSSGGSTSNGDPGDGPVFSRYLLYWTEAKDTELRLGIADGPPVRVRGDEVLLRDDEDRPIDAPCVVDRRAVVRRIPLELDLPDGADPRWLRIEPVSPHYGGKMYSTQNGNMAVRDDQGEWSLQARDRGPWRLVALLPGCGPQELHVPEAPADGGERPVRLKLDRTGMLSLRFTMPARPRASADFNLRVKDDSGGLQYYIQDTSIGLRELKPGEPFTLPFPIGLAPGKYTIEVDLPAAGDASSRSFEREVEIRADQPVVLDLDGEG